VEAAGASNPTATGNDGGTIKTQPICDRCWHQRNTLEPVRAAEPMEEVCYACKQTTRSGIYVRMTSMTLPPFEEPPLEGDADDPRRLKMALKIAAENIGRLADHNAHLTAALNTAMRMIDLLMDDLRHNNILPSGVSVVAKATFDQEMERLLRRRS
jgi:hypothetical protein